ncbi:NADH:flavin oxidoreductase/NADH oxidase [Athelia psychrophila]|uniref:NADH:flavin oxidoreductase/NADH oxidase n=1 Tax=Athelia psychrophila TaxID=1759441 RepID=A0A166Q7Y6_9AGAM|nr:NADH:flavin oxidoreductase/NADH oxidase [Fibularhizoctonia sp. CBS 109695]
MKLFEPIQVGNSSLLHRVVLAPLTRNRGTSAHVPGPTMPEYYAQRASVPGTLLVTEATFIAPQAGGYPNVPGIWNEEQIEGWKKVTAAVHEKGSFIYLQLWALGRAANPTQLAKEGVSGGYVSSSSIPLKSQTEAGVPPPRTLDIAEVREYVQLYATAAENAIKAGFDGVEVHGANGYLIDQFTQDVSNKRTDAYGGSIENRARFALEIVDAIVKKIGAKKTGIRFSPWGYFQDMRMSDPIPTFSYLVSSLVSAHPELAFVHVVEPRISGASDRTDVGDHEQNDFIRDITRKAGGITKVISAGGYTRQQAIEAAEEKGDLVAFGRAYIANPDLPTRLKEDIPLTLGNRKTYYIPGDFTGIGYTDYPFADAASRL